MDCGPGVDDLCCIPLCTTGGLVAIKNPEVFRTNNSWSLRMVLELYTPVCPCLGSIDTLCVLFLLSLDNTLYAGVHVDFMGTDAALFRTMGPRPAVRTEQHDSRWLYGSSLSIN